MVALRSMKPYFYASVVLLCLSLLSNLVASRIAPGPNDLEIHEPVSIPIEIAVNKSHHEIVYLDYPWQPIHDQRPGRENHQNWQYPDTSAYCLHVNPGYNKPFQPPRESHGPVCWNWLHRDQKYTWNKFKRQRPQFIPCVPPFAGIEGPVNSDTVRWSKYQITIMAEWWYNIEHCRAGCET